MLMTSPWGSRSMIKVEEGKAALLNSNTQQVPQLSRRSQASILKNPPTKPQTPTNLTTMSAPNAGRQSPDPERQTDAQQKGAQAAPHIGAGPEQGSKQASEQDKSALSSNPTHILEKHAEDTTSKK